MARTHKQDRMLRWVRKAVDMGPGLGFVHDKIVKALEAAYQEGLKEGIARAKFDPGPPGLIGREERPEKFRRTP